MEQINLNTLTADHPISVYFEENNYLKKAIQDFSDVDLKTDFQKAYNLFNQIAAVDIRYTRKENQLFPYLEKRGWNGPSTGMWTFQDNNRKLIKTVRQKLESRNFDNIEHDINLMLSEVIRMIQVEEMRLFPIALDILQPEDWEQMKTGEREIGWMHKKSTPSTSETTDSNNQSPQTALGEFKMNEGLMTLEQVNLMLQAIPFDLTYVDENDRVRFYNRGEDRVFPRSAGVIGREVRFCHPPKSVDTVLEILEEFRTGRQNEAEFWINYRGKTIHIRYFAVRDHLKNYRGVIEVSQDVTAIKKIEGERRLLNWSAHPTN